MDHEQQSASDAAGGKEGRYANYFEVGHNVFEFVLDFGQLYRDDESASIHTRIIAGPAYAQALRRVLQNALDEYERKFGPIGEPGDVEPTDELLLVAGDAAAAEDTVTPVPPTPAGIDMSTAQSAPADKTTPPAPPPSVGDEVQQLRDKVAKDEAAIVEQTKALEAEKQKLTFADATLTDIDTAADEYEAAAEKLEQQWDDLKTYLKMKHDSLGAVVSPEQATAIEGKVSEYDTATKALRTTLDKALDDQESANANLANAKTAAADLEAAFTGIKNYKATLDDWLAHAGELRTQIDALDPVHQGARMYFLLMELDAQLAEHASIEDADAYRKELEASLHDQLQGADALNALTPVAEQADAAATAAKTAYDEQVGKRSETLLAAMDELDKTNEDDDGAGTTPPATTPPAGATAA